MLYLMNRYIVGIAESQELLPTHKYRWRIVKYSEGIHPAWGREDH